MEKITDTLSLQARKPRLAATLFTSILLLGGCSDNEPKPQTRTSSTSHEKPTASNPPQATQNCQAVAVEWQAMPTNINIKAMVEMLGVDASRVREGSWGPATCVEAVNDEDIGRLDKDPVTINPIGSICAIVGIQQYEGPPAEGKTYHHVLAACASPEAN